MSAFILSNYDDDRLHAIAREQQRRADELQREAAQAQRQADKARKEIKRRKAAGNKGEDA